MHERRSKIYIDGDMLKFILMRLFVHAALASVLDLQDVGSKAGKMYLTIQVTSSKDRVTIAVDSQVIADVSSSSNDTSHPGNSTNGLHFAAISPSNGKVLLQRIFDTAVFGEEVVIPAILDSLDKEILIFAVKFDAALQLSKDIRMFLKSLGASAIYQAGYKSYFVWVFSKGGKTYLESLQNINQSNIEYHVGSPVHVAVLVSTTDSCWNPDKESVAEEKKRAQFCNNYGGYGPLCDCEDPSEITHVPKKLEDNALQDVPLIIIASNRPQSLYRCIISLLEQPGGDKKQIFVVIDGKHQEVTDLLQMLQISYAVNTFANQTLPGVGGRISAHYKFGLERTLDLFPKSEFVIVLEEDVLASPDMLSYFSKTSAILESDPSLYCACAWNDLAAMHTGGNPHRVLRIETQPAYGWLATRKVIKEFLSSWVPQEKNYDWDIYVRGPQIRGSRECLVPEVPRSFHMGTSGIHIKGYAIYSEFFGHLTTKGKNIALHNLNRLTQEKYEEEIYSLLESDKVIFLNTSLHSCNRNFLPRNMTKDIEEKILVIFVSMESSIDGDAWKRLASCLGIFSNDVRNHHRGLFRFYFYNISIFVIGYPFSDYSFFKPSFVTPVSPYMTQWDRKYLKNMFLMNRNRFRVPDMEQQLPHPVILDGPKEFLIYE